MQLNESKKYLVGVSGGPDSMYLLEQLRSNKIDDIIVCHVNYHYRETADDDQKLVEAYCQQHNLPLEILSIQQDYQKLNNNFEAWAREKRYTFFVQMGDKHQTQYLLLGHNLNDHIETYLMQKKRQNLVRYYGIQKINQYQHLTVIRPLLTTTKSAILTWLNAHKIDYALDSTNNDLMLIRNKIRHQLKESTFTYYIDKINQANKDLEKIHNEVIMFVKNNTNHVELNINNYLKNASLEFIQRCLYWWLEQEHWKQIIQNRANKTVFELAKKIKHSSKIFWQSPIHQWLVFKDYNKLKIIPLAAITIQTYTINNDKEFDKISAFVNHLEIYQAIIQDQKNFPYVVSNDYAWYKNYTMVGLKKTNHFFAEHKISYASRMMNAVVFNKEKCKIINSVK